MRGLAEGRRKRAEVFQRLAGGLSDRKSRMGSEKYRLACGIRQCALLCVGVGKPIRVLGWGWGSNPRVAYRSDQWKETPGRICF